MEKTRRCAKYNHVLRRSSGPTLRGTRTRSDAKTNRQSASQKLTVAPRACQILEEKSTSCRRNRKRLGLAAYNGFLYCDECGRVLTPHRGSGKGYYVCLGH